MNESSRTVLPRSVPEIANPRSRSALETELLIKVGESMVLGEKVQRLRRRDSVVSSNVVVIEVAEVRGMERVHIRVRVVLRLLRDVEAAVKHR